MRAGSCIYLSARLRARGFTLLEVLVALAILSISLTALTRVGSQQARNLEILRSNTYATWVASEVVENIRLDSGALGPGRRQGQQLMGHEIWYWEANVVNTEVPDILRIDVTVFNDPGRTQGVLDLAGFAEQRP